ncbi:MAG: hypothetical protein AAF432_13050 [Planctomycetota bacterium]
MLKSIVAIVGMVAVGILVWRALERQEARDSPGDSEDGSRL